MTLQHLKERFYFQLDGNYPKEELQSFFSILSQHILNYTRLDTLLKAEEELQGSQIAFFEDAIERLKNYEPVQYIIGAAEFYGIPFKVNPSTLIPRPETEELVEWILESEAVTSLHDFQILDIGTGSGCIAIALSKHLETAQVEAIDISEKTLATARENALMNEVDVNFSKMDILKTTQLPKTYDIIVSNPPYVRDLEKAQMQPNVLVHEPAGALFVSDQDPLLFYRKIGELAMKYLKPNGTLYFEINEYLGGEMQELLEKQGFYTIEIKKDIFGKDRMMRSIRNE